MVKIYILATVLFCTVANSFGQIKNFTAISVSSPPVVDGIIDAQYLFYGNGMEVLSNCIDNSNSDCVSTSTAICDRTTKWSAVYDRTSLFIVIQVKDDSIGAGDGVELFFSMKNNRTSNCPFYFPIAYDNSTFHIVSSAPNALPFEISSPNGHARIVGRQAVKLTADGYNMEFEIL